MLLRNALLALVTLVLMIGAACGDDSDDGANGGGTPSGVTPDATGGDPPDVESGVVELTWWGQAMFELLAADGTRILMDPYGEIGYRVPAPTELEVDVATISHEHPDHNNAALAGDADVLRGLGELSVNDINETVGEVRLYTVGSFHDNAQGEERGPNAIFIIETGGMRVAHMGDIGQLELTQEQLDAIGAIDVLLVPTGGTFTVDAAGATGLVAQIGPRIVVPMHYGTDALSFDLAPVSDFTAGKPANELGSSTVGLDVDALPEMGAAEVWVLEPLGG